MLPREILLHVQGKRCHWPPSFLRKDGFSGDLLEESLRWLVDHGYLQRAGKKFFSRCRLCPRRCGAAGPRRYALTRKGNFFLETSQKISPADLPPQIH